jgi:predicted metalloprotease
VSGIYAMYPGREDLPEIACAGTIGYDSVEMNARYLPCFDDAGDAILDGDMILYDDEGLFPKIEEDLGQAALGIIAAHEWGHAIEARAHIFNLNDPTVGQEQQADCFAGAWAAHVARGESPYLPQFGDEEVQTGIAAMIFVRDPVGFSPQQAGAHGTGFDRVGAFQEGFIKGGQRCADFVDDPNPRIDLVFTEQDIVTGGNLPLSDAMELLPPSLEIYWKPTLDASGVPFTPPTLAPFDTDGPYPECDGLSGEQLRNRAVFCAGNDTIAFDQQFVEQLYDRIGDLAFIYPIAIAYGDAVQQALGLALSGEPEALLDDCLVGAWVIDIVPVSGSDPPTATNPNQTIMLSAGDLDEVVQAALLFGDKSSTANEVGTAFEKIDAFRAGVLGGLPACQERLG